MEEEMNTTERPEDAARRMAQQVQQLTEENYKLMQALQEIAADSEEAGGVRVAVAAILSVTNGPAFLIAHPLL